MYTCVCTTLFIFHSIARNWLLVTRAVVCWCTPLHGVDSVSDCKKEVVKQVKLSQSLTYLLIFTVHLQCSCQYTLHMFVARKNKSYHSSARGGGVLWWACLFVCFFTTNPIFSYFCMLPITVTRSSSGGIAVRYALPVLWITLYLHITGHMESCQYCCGEWRHCIVACRPAASYWLRCVMDDDGRARRDYTIIVQGVSGAESAMHRLNKRWIRGDSGLLLRSWVNTAVLADRWNCVTFCDPATQYRWPCSIMNSKCRLMCQEVFSGQRIFNNHR